jgi:hypothetical protein
MYCCAARPALHPSVTSGLFEIRLRVAPSMMAAIRTLVEAVLDGFEAFLDDFGHFGRHWAIFGQGSLPSKYLFSILLGWVGNLIKEPTRKLI